MEEGNDGIVQEFTLWKSGGQRVILKVHLLMYIYFLQLLDPDYQETPLFKKKNPLIIPIFVVLLSVLRFEYEMHCTC